MKFLGSSKITLSILIVLLTATFSLLSFPTSEVKLTLVSDEEEYQLGEAVKLNLILKNTGTNELTILDSFGIATGTLNVFISRNGKNYSRYEHSGWGLLDIVNVKTIVGPGNDIRTNAELLWTGAGSHSEFLFSESGNYYLKATYNAVLEGPQTSISIESEPILVAVREPKDEDLLVWNRMKMKGDLAYFIQEGDVRVPGYKTQERDAFLAEVKDILSNFPNSSYAGPLNRSLEKFVAAEASREEIRKKKNDRK